MATTAFLILQSPRPALADGVVDIAAGNFHACAVLADGGVKCWGYNLFAQIGDGTSGDFARTTPVDVCQTYDEETATCAEPLTGIAHIAASFLHTCVVTGAGGVKCWGNNLGGQLGVEEAEACPGAVLDSSSRCARTPVDVAGLPLGVRSVAAGNLHTCAVIEDGSAYCWGTNVTGELGDGTTMSTSTPVQVNTEEQIVEIAAGRHHTCALTTNGTVLCWGDGTMGRLGNIPAESCPGFWVGDPTPCSTVPRPVCAEHGQNPGECERQLQDVTAISAGGSNTCTLTSTQSVACWGIDGSGFLGAETEDMCVSSLPHSDPVACASTPLEVTGLRGEATAIDVGGLFHSCAVTVGGGLKCWGNNFVGSLGDGSEEDRPAPVGVLEDVGGSLMSGVADVASGWLFACALNTSGAVKCWGSNCCGQHGNGEQDFDAHPYPTDVSGFEPKTLPVVLGDVNCDGAVTSVDAALILQLEAGLIAALPCPANGDLSGDGSVDSIDAALILQFTAGLAGSLPR